MRQAEKKPSTAPELWAEYRRRPEAGLKKELALAYLPLVRYLAGRLTVRLPPGLSQEDLIGYGVLGLLEAIERYDPGRGAKFETYASTRIRGAMLDALRRHSWAPRGVLDRAKEAARAVGKLEQDLGRPPTEAEVAASLGITAEQLGDIWQAAHEAALVSLEEYGGQGEERRRGSVLADADSPDPARVLEEKELLGALQAALAELPEQDRLVLNLYFYEGLTLREIGAVLGVSESRACQLRGRALSRLRARLVAEGY